MLRDFKVVLIISILNFVCINAMAEDVGHLRVSGFGDVGVVYTNSDHYRFRDDISGEITDFSKQFDYQSINNLGIHLEYKFNSQWDVVTQFLYRNQNNYSFNDLTNLAFVRYQPDANWTVRAGRTAFDLFMLAQYRDISFAYPWAKVPTEVYGLTPYRSLDGVDVTYFDYLNNDLEYRVKLFTGQTRADISFFNATDELEIDDVYGSSIELGTIDWTVSFKHTHATLNNELTSAFNILDAMMQIPAQFWPNRDKFVEDFRLSGKTARYTSIGAQYNWENFEFMAEGVSLSGDATPIQKAKSGYVSVTYLHKKHHFFYSFAIADSDTFTFDTSQISLEFLPPETNLLIAGINESAGFFAPKQTTHSLGWRYDILDNIALKFQYDHNHVKTGGGTLWQTQGAISDTPKEDFNTLFFTVSFTF